MKKMTDYNQIFVHPKLKLQSIEIFKLSINLVSINDLKISIDCTFDFRCTKIQLQSIIFHSTWAKIVRILSKTI